MSHQLTEKATHSLLLDGLLSGRQSWEVTDYKSNVLRNIITFYIKK